MEAIYEDVATSLVREYLKRKGYNETYKVLGEESPRTISSISNRSELARVLHINILVKQNKIHSCPLKTILEIITRYLLENSLESLQHKSSRYTHGDESDSIVIEDDLETELMAGRGNEDLMTRPQITTETDIQSHGAKQNRRQSGKTFKPILTEEEVEITSDRDLLGESVYTSGDDGNLAQRLVRYTEQRQSISDTSTPPDYTNVNTNTPSDDSEPLPNVHTEIRSSVSSHEYDNLERIDSREKSPEQTEEGAMGEDNTVLEGGEVAERENNELPQPTLLLKPKPPNKLKQLELTKPKTDLEKSIELLRARRLLMKKKITASLDDNANGASGDIDEAAQTDRQTFMTQSDEVEQETDEQDDSHAPKEDDDSNFSPRVICDPLEEQPDLILAEPQKSISPDSVKHHAEYKPVKAAISTAKPIDIHTAMNLKSLVFGSASAAIPDCIMNQALTFCDLPNMRILLDQSQSNPGADGPITALQAYLLLHILYFDENSRAWKTERKLNPTGRERSLLFARALCSLFWKIGDEEKAVLALPTQSSVLSGGGRFKADGLTETLMLNIFDNRDELQRALYKFLPYFEDDDSPGLLLLIYSAVLSRGIELILDDMSSTDEPLIRAYNQNISESKQIHYSSRELMHLLICGKAASYAHNDMIEVACGIGRRELLRGIPMRNDIGLLSLNEHTNRKYQVGTFLKTPKYPVWLIEIEQKNIRSYSLVFCMNKDLISDWKAERRFFLFYHDPFSERESPVKITLDTTNAYFETPSEDETPVLDLCLRTKWPDALIDWNGAEPTFLENSTDDYFDELLSKLG